MKKPLRFALLFALLLAGSHADTRIPGTPRRVLYAQKPAAFSGTLPLSMVFIDVGDGGKSEVEGIATLQTRTQPNYKSGKIESQIFEGEFIPRAPKSGGSIGFTVFSDDGVDVEVDGKPLLQRFGKGQHLPDLTQSLQDVPGPENGRWTPGKRYFIRIKYSNIIFTGDADIDGLTVFAHNGGGAVPTVEFQNFTRGSDRVVPARVKKFDLPGGTKELTIKLKNVGEKDKATVKLVRKDNKNSGTASLDAEKDIDEVPVKEGQKITIYGRNLSSAPRDIELQGLVNGKLAGSFEFTVFTVNLVPFAEGSAVKGDTAIPEGAKANAGVGPLSLRENYTSGRPDEMYGFLRYPIFGKETIFGGIYFRGQVLPPGIMPGDFNRNQPNRDANFHLPRLVSARMYKNDCLVPYRSEMQGSALGIFAYTQGYSDDKFNASRDSLADKDIAKDEHLYVHSEDSAKATLGRFLNPQLNDTFRLRFNAIESVTYARTPCSNKVEWYWAFSEKRTAQGLEQLKDAGVDDNKVGLKNLHLTPDLKAPKPPANVIEITSIKPSAVRQGQENVPIQITGKNFPVNAKCPPAVTFRLAVFTPRETKHFDIGVLDLKVEQAGLITGQMSIPENWETGTVRRRFARRRKQASHSSGAIEMNLERSLP